MPTKLPTKPADANTQKRMPPNVEKRKYLILSQFWTSADDYGRPDGAPYGGARESNPTRLTVPHPVKAAHNISMA